MHATAKGTMLSVLAAALLALVGPAWAVLSTTPVFLQQHYLSLTQFLQGTDAAGTYKTLYTPTSTHGGKCYRLTMTNTDDGAPHVVTLQLERGTAPAVLYGGTAITTELNAGFDPGVPPQNVLSASVWPDLSGDSDGNRYFYVAFGVSVRVTYATPLTAGKVISLQLTCVEF